MKWVQGLVTCILYTVVEKAKLAVVKQTELVLEKCY